MHVHRLSLVGLVDYRWTLYMIQKKVLLQGRSLYNDTIAYSSACGTAVYGL